MRDKHFMIEEDLIHFLFMDNNMRIGSQKLNEIINNTKSFSDKRGIGFEERDLYFYRYFSQIFYINYSKNRDGFNQNHTKR